MSACPPPVCKESYVATEKLTSCSKLRLTRITVSPLYYELASLAVPIIYLLSIFGDKTPQMLIICLANSNDTKLFSKDESVYYKLQEVLNNRYDWNLRNSLYFDVKNVMLLLLLENAILMNLIRR